MTSRSDPHDYGQTIGIGPWARPTNPHPDSPMGRAFARQAAQTAIPGTGPDLAGLARLKAAAPLKPRKAQEPCDLGLFSDCALQTDLVDMARKPTNSYATDGKCHNANAGTYNHECGKPATWIGTNRDGFAMGFCCDCKASGTESRPVTTWRRT